MAGAFTWAFRDEEEISTKIAFRKDIWYEQELGRRQDGDARTHTQWRADVDAEWRDLMEPIVRRHVERLVGGKRDSTITKGWEYQTAITAAKPKGDAGDDVAAAYHITIRPDASRTTFGDFYVRLQAWLGKARLTSYHVALEQKATDVDAVDLGKGYHAHIVAHTTQRRDSLQRSIITKFGDIMSPQALSIIRAATPTAIVQDYLLQHKSQDGHKEATRLADAAWRQHVGLAQIYTESCPMSRFLRQPIKTS